MGPAVALVNFAKGTSVLTRVLNFQVSAIIIIHYYDIFITAYLEDFSCDISMYHRR